MFEVGVPDVLIEQSGVEDGVNEAFFSVRFARFCVSGGDFGTDVTRELDKAKRGAKRGLHRFASKGKVGKSRRIALGGDKKQNIKREFHGRHVGHVGEGRRVKMKGGSERPGKRGRWSLSEIDKRDKGVFK